MLSDLEEAIRSRFIVDDGRNELQNSTKQESAFDNSAKTVAVSGSTFSPAVSADLCAEGCAPVNNGDGTYGVVAGVAQIGTKAYTSLQAAVNAAQDGETSYYVIHNIGTMVIDQANVVNNSGYWRRRCDSCASYGKQGQKRLRYAN